MVRNSFVRKPKERRNKEQRDRQRKLREAAKLERKPSRDDIARVLLHWAITKCIERGQENMLNRVQDEVVSILAVQGFDEGKAYEVFDDLIERYTKQRWGFRRKIHLTPPITS
jgi:hypothetical protein